MNTNSTNEKELIERQRMWQFLSKEKRDKIIDKIISRHETYEEEQKQHNEFKEWLTELLEKHGKSYEEEMEKIRKEHNLRWIPPKRKELTTEERNYFLSLPKEEQRNMIENSLISNNELKDLINIRKNTKYQ